MPTLTGQESPPLTHRPPVMVVMASVVRMLMPRLSQHILPMVFVLMLMVMVFVHLSPVLLDTLVLLPLLLLGLHRELASVVLSLLMSMVFIPMLLEFLLVFLTTELFMESTSSILLDTPSSMSAVASVALMLMLKLTMDIPMGMDTVTMDTMATDVDITMVKLFPLL